MTTNVNTIVGQLVLGGNLNTNEVDTILIPIINAGFELCSQQNGVYIIYKRA